jgi:hypothetical protein
MSENTQKSELVVPETTPTPPSTTVALPAGTVVTTINIEELKSNSVVVIKIAPEGMQQRMAATQQIAMALRPLREQIQAKNIAFIVMGTGEGMEVVDEEQMKELGWEKKEKTRIITL